MACSERSPGCPGRVLLQFQLFMPENFQAPVVNFSFDSPVLPRQGQLATDQDQASGSGADPGKASLVDIPTRVCADGQIEWRNDIPDGWAAFLGPVRSAILLVASGEMTTSMRRNEGGLGQSKKRG